MGSETKTEFNSMDEFYPFYLSEHADRINRRFHFIGTSLGLASVVAALVTLNAWWLLAGVVAGYANAWVGHFFFEKNKPATFDYPVRSYLADWIMYKDMLTGKLSF